MSQAVRYAETLPDPRLDEHVLTYWSLTVDAGATDPVHHVWPDGCLSLACVRGAPGGTVVTGPRTEPLRHPVRAGALYWGVRFRPDAGAPLLALDAAKLRDVVGLAEPWLGSRVRALGAALAGAHGDAEAARTFDLWLTPMLSAAAPLSRPLRAAVTSITASHGDRRIADVADDAGISLRHLERLFGAAVGLTPVEYARIRRQRSAMARLALAEAATDDGGEPMLVREFGRLTGLPAAAAAEALARDGTPAS